MGEFEAKHLLFGRCHDKSLERALNWERSQASGRPLNGDESSYLWRMYKFRNATPAASIE